MRIYGAWAGNPNGTKEDENRCVVQIWQRIRTPYQCNRKRGYGIKEDRCKQHASDRWDIYVPKDKEL